MSEQIPVTPDALAEGEDQDSLHVVASDIAVQRLLMVNVVYLGEEGAGPERWVLVDAGLKGKAHAIRHAAESRFGKDAPPAAIILTHGHFDHVGALRDLLEFWPVPVYAHELEFPFLDGRSEYPPPDPEVGGGLMARLAGFYPRGPIDIRPWLRPLPEDGSVPRRLGWRWIHTPGHSPGHVSLWRETDRTVIAGDAFITTNQESAYAVLRQQPELHGPPQYYTPDWVAAKHSVEHLAALNPELAVTGHGPPLSGPDMREALHRLAREFDQVAVPEEGRYVGSPGLAGQRPAFGEA